MATALKEVLIASAIESLDINSYWPASNSSDELNSDDDCDGEYPIILLFYETLLDSMLSTGLVTPNEVQRSISFLMKGYGRVKNGETAEDLDYDDLNNCFAYLHRYAACHTALVRNSLKKVFHVAPPTPIKRILCLKDSLDVISLGGGPGNDLVGFCSALYGKHYGFVQMNFSIIDQMIGWKILINKTEKMLRQEKHGNASMLFKDVKVQMFFIQGDLLNSHSWGCDLKSKLHNADLFLLVKVLSVVPDRNKIQFLKNVVTAMKPGAALIYIDTPFPSFAFAAVDQWLECVYLCEKKKFVFEYEVDRFGFPNITNSRAHVRVYVKKFVVLSS